jgi:WD40 repeat protein
MPDHPSSVAQDTASSSAPSLPPRIDAGQDLDNVLGEVSRMFGQAAGHAAPLAALAEDTINDHLTDMAVDAEPRAVTRSETPTSDAPLTDAADLFRSAPNEEPPSAPQAEQSADESPEQPPTEIAESAEPMLSAAEPAASSAETGTPAPPATGAEVGSSRASMVRPTVERAQQSFYALPRFTRRLPKRLRIVAGMLAAALVGWIGGAVMTRTPASTTVEKAAPEVVSEQAQQETAAEKAKAAELEEQLQKAQRAREDAEHERDQTRERIQQSAALLRTEQQSSAAQRARDEESRKQALANFQKAHDRLGLMQLRAYDAQLARVRDCRQTRPGLAAALLEDANTCPPELRDFAWGYFYARSKNDRATWRGSAPANAAAWSPDGTLVAVATTDGSIALRDAATGEPIASLAAHAGGVNSLAFSQHGEWLASAGADATVKLWHVASRRLEATFFGHLGKVLAVAVAPDASALVSGGDDGTVKFWDVATRRATATRWGHPRNREPDDVGDPTRLVRSVAFSPDGRLIASGGYQVVRIWSTDADEKATLTVPGGDISALAFTPDSATLAIGNERSICLRDVDTLLERCTPQVVDAPLNGLSFSPDGAWLAAAVGPDGLVFSRTIRPSPTEEPENKRRSRISDAPSYDLGNSRRLFGHDGLVTGVTFAPNGQLIATSGADGTLRLWEPRGGIVDQGGPDFVLRDVPPTAAVAYSPDSRCLAAGSADSIVLWDPRTRVEIARLANRSGGIRRLAFSPSGTHLASASGDWPILIWTVGAQRVEFALNGHTAGVNALAYSADGKLLVSAGDDATLRLWNPTTGQPIAALSGHSGPVLSAAISADGKLAASGGTDCTVRLWSVDGKKPLATLARHTNPVAAIAFSPDGRFLVTGEGRSSRQIEGGAKAARRPLRLWQIAERKEILTFGPANGDVVDVAFSPDSKTLAVSGPSGVSLWDPQTGELRETIRPPMTTARSIERPSDSSPAWPIAFSPDGLSLAAGGDASLSIWTAAPFSSPVGKTTTR